MAPLDRMMRAAIILLGSTAFVLEVIRSIVELSMREKLVNYVSTWIPKGINRFDAQLQCIIGRHAKDVLSSL
jgi:hypothetical protein